MPKVKQQFFKTAGVSLDDKGNSLTANCKRVFVTGYLSASQTAADFNGGTIELNDVQTAFVAGLNHCGKQKFFKTTPNAGGNSIVSTLDRAFVIGTLDVNGLTALDFDGNVIDLKGNTNIFAAGLDNCGHQKFFQTAGNNESNISTYPIVTDDKPAAALPAIPKASTISCLLSPSIFPAAAVAPKVAQFPVG